MSARAGFTLIEVLVGLTVASLALLAGMSTLGFIDERARHAEAHLAEAIGGATQRALITDWLTGARGRAVTGEQFEGFLEEIASGTSSLLLLPTVAATPLEGTTTVIGLYIDMDEETPERGLVAEMTGVTLGMEPRRMELVPEAGRLIVRYMTQFDTGENGWMEEWPSSSTLPRMIELTLEPAPGAVLPPLLRYPIRVATTAPR